MKKYFLLLVIIAFLGCTKEVNLELSDVEDAIVVYSIFNDANYFKVMVSKTSFFGDSVDHFISDATVTIKAQKSKMEKTLAYQDNGYYYDTAFFPQYNEIYHLEVEVPGYKTLSATDSLPLPPDVKNIYLISTDRYDIEALYYRYHNIFMTLNDPLSASNYYEILCYELELTKKFERVEVGSDEAFIVNEGDSKLSLGTLLFSDEQINGKETKIKLYARCHIESDTVRLNTAFYIASISPTLYRYRKQEVRHIVSGYEFWNPIEPSPMYSNITNGYGVFAGYSARSFMLHHENK